MNIKALITTLVLGTSSVAMARPVTLLGPPVVRDHRTQPTSDCGVPALPAPIQQPSYQEPGWGRPRAPKSWTTLGSVNQIVDGEMPFQVNPYSQRFSTLKLENTGGKTLLFRVLIQFANGHTQTVELGRHYLLASNPSLTIDLDGSARGISKVTVIGRNARQSTYRVLAI